MNKHLFISLIALTALIPVTSFAASITNVSNGSDTQIQNSFLSDLLMASTNNAAITNAVQTMTTSGGNAISSSGKQSNVSIATGSAIAASSISDEANNVTQSQSFESADTSHDSISDITDGSSANIQTEETISGAMTAQNTVSQTNTITTSAVSGNNSIISGGDIAGATIATGTGSSSTLITSRFNITLQSISRSIK